MGNEKTERKPQITVQTTAPLKWIYDAARDRVAIGATRLMQAGLLSLFRHPDLAQEALDELYEFERGPALPKSREEADDWVREHCPLRVGSTVEKAVQDGRARREGQSARGKKGRGTA